MFTHFKRLLTMTTYFTGSTSTYTVISNSEQDFINLNFWTVFISITIFNFEPEFRYIYKDNLDYILCFKDHKYLKLGKCHGQYVSIDRYELDEDSIDPFEYDYDFDQEDFEDLDKWGYYFSDEFGFFSEDVKDIPNIPLDKCFDSNDVVSIPELEDDNWFDENDIAIIPDSSPLEKMKQELNKLGAWARSA